MAKLVRAGRGEWAVLPEGTVAEGREVRVRGGLLPTVRHAKAAPLEPKLVPNRREAPPHPRVIQGIPEVLGGASDPAALTDAPREPEAVVPIEAPGSPDLLVREGRDAGPAGLPAREGPAAPAVVDDPPTRALPVFRSRL